MEGEKVPTSWGLVFSFNLRVSTGGCLPTFTSATDVTHLFVHLVKSPS